MGSFMRPKDIVPPRRLARKIARQRSAPAPRRPHDGVLIVGAGPTGLTLACELARRGVPHRLVDLAPQPFAGSRAKGTQPRTLEVFSRPCAAPSPRCWIPTSPNARRSRAACSGCRPGWGRPSWPAVQDTQGHATATRDPGERALFAIRPTAWSAWRRIARKSPTSSPGCATPGRSPAAEHAGRIISP